MFVEQLLDHQHEARRTETALERAVLDARLLDRVEHVVAVEIFNGLHHGAVREGSKVQAARHRAAVDDQGAAPAQSLAAALAGAIETEIVAHHFEQAVVRGDLRRNLFAIEREGDGAGGGHRACLLPQPASSPRLRGEGWGEGALCRLMSFETQSITHPRLDDFASPAAPAARLRG